MDALRMTRAGEVLLRPDAGRVIAKAFVPGDEMYPDGSTRLQTMVERILALTDRDIAHTLAVAADDFAPRHRDLDGVLDRNFEIVASRLTHLDAASVSPDRRRLIGAYFTHEYSIEAAALANPSIVAAPDQSGVDDGSVRFVMSLRAIGEGHISSIEFRTGVVTADAEVYLEPTSGYVSTGERRPHAFDKSFFETKLADMGMLNDLEAWVLGRLDERFTMADLEGAIAALHESGVERSISGETTRTLHWLASSNYRTSFPASVQLSERVLFPSGPSESQGMEDARFVRFVDDDGSVTYYATYTAFDGHQILPQLIETSDFDEFRVLTMSGSAARNKGIAIFPRKIDGNYVALGRLDNVNNFVMTSNDIRVWRTATLIQEPALPWELMQLGNCGSPIETEAGWLVITHGVGAFRQYTLGALLLDLHEPSRVIGHLKQPLLGPADDERDGYVPNVVYSCGSMIHADHLVLPYGYADVDTRVATISVTELVSRLAPAGG